MGKGANRGGANPPPGASPGSATEDRQGNSSDSPPQTAPMELDGAPVSPYWARWVDYQQTKTVIRVRQRLKLTQREFSRLLAVSPGTVGHWEAGTRVPSRLHCRLLACIDLAPQENVDGRQWRVLFGHPGVEYSQMAYLALVTNVPIGDRRG